MTKLTKQRLSIGAAVIVLIAGFVVAGRLASSREAPPTRERVRAVREVAVATPQPTSVDVDVALQGRLVAVETVPLFAEVTGTFEESSHPFKIGVYYGKGDLLARLDNTVERYNVLASKSALANSLAQSMPELKLDYPATFPAWNAYLGDFDPEQPLPPLPEVGSDAARYFLNARNIYNQYYSIKAAEERLAKYTLRAPVAGTLTEVNATVGALVRAGQPLGTLTASSYELAATVPVSDLAYLSPGTTAELTGPGGEAYAARVSRISTQVDPNTQTATVYLGVQGSGLRAGLYLRGLAEGEALDDVVALDQGLLVGQNEIYVVEDSTLRRESVEVVRRAGDRVFVRGLPPGTAILAEPLPSAYVGMSVAPRPTEPSIAEPTSATTAKAPTDATPAG